MFGLYDAKLNSTSKSDNMASGFDPTGLERAAKAARELDASANVKDFKY